MNVIFGAMGRHNFGDMLMPHVIEKMLPNINFTVADLIASDMTEYGGHKVESISSFFDCEEPVNVIHGGGDTGTCGMVDALKMLSAKNYDKRYDDILIGYVLSKSVFKNAGKFITNSIGAVSDYSAPILSEFDYTSCRDLKSCGYGGAHVPDCAVMVRELFDDKIQSHNIYNFDYIAVQMNAKFIKKNQREVEERISKLVKETRLPIVFFCAGTAPWHDSLEVYKDKFPNHIYCDDFNIWSICNVIANAKMYVGTSLHARIIAMLYDVPRVSLEDLDKVKFFIDEWDGRDDLIQCYKNSIKEWASIL
jgi:hypothetical protein